MVINERSERVYEGGQWVTYRQVTLHFGTYLRTDFYANGQLVNSQEKAAR